jgi:hypothetical protein
MFVVVGSGDDDGWLIGVAPALEHGGQHQPANARYDSTMKK